VDTAFSSIVKELAGSVLSSAFDPQPVRFKRTDEAGIGPLRTGCNKPFGTLHSFRSQLNRNAFLRGCAEFTHEAPVEHLIVGLGFLHGSTTVVESMFHTVGDANSVNIPPEFATAIQVHILSEHGNEVLLFHSHPRNVLNAVFDNSPLPSGVDRRALVGFHSDLRVLGKALVGGGRVRFYLGENGYVREFRTPDLLPLMEAAMSAATNP